MHCTLDDWGERFKNPGLWLFLRVLMHYFWCNWGKYFQIWDSDYFLRGFMHCTWDDWGERFKNPGLWLFLRVAMHCFWCNCGEIFPNPGLWLFFSGFMFCTWDDWGGVSQMCPRLEKIGKFFPPKQFFKREKGWFCYDTFCWEGHWPPDWSWCQSKNYFWDEGVSGFMLCCPGWWVWWSIFQNIFEIFVCG